MLGALGAGLYSIGIPKDSIVKYNTALQSDQFLLIAHGTAAEVAKAKEIIDTTNPVQSTLHTIEARSAGILAVSAWRGWPASRPAQRRRCEVVRRVLLATFVSGLLLTISGCSNSRFSSNGSYNFGIGSSIHSVGGGGDRLQSNPSTPIQTADITVTPPSPSIAVDSTMQFTATAKDNNGMAFQWASSAPNVATINSSGAATGMGAGTTQITATAGGLTSPPVVLTLCDFRHL